MFLFDNLLALYYYSISILSRHFYIFNHTHRDTCNMLIYIVLYNHSSFLQRIGSTLHITQKPSFIHRLVKVILSLSGFLAYAFAAIFTEDWWQIIALLLMTVFFISTYILSKELLNYRADLRSYADIEEEISNYLAIKEKIIDKIGELPMEQSTSGAPYRMSSIQPGVRLFALQRRRTSYCRVLEDAGFSYSPDMMLNTPVFVEKGYFLHHAKDARCEIKHSVSEWSDQSESTSVLQAIFASITRYDRHKASFDELSMSAAIASVEELEELYNLITEVW